MSVSVEVSDDCLRVSGSMTLATATGLLARGQQLIGSNKPVFDLSGVSEVDSSGLAVLFGWLRASQDQGKELRIVSPPANLISLAQVYGAEELLPLSQ